MTVGLDQLGEMLQSADVVVAGTGAGEPVVTVDLVTAARAASAASRPLNIVDIAMPRDVETGVDELAGVTVFDLDDLSRWADRGLAHRAAESEQVSVIVAEHVEDFRVESTARQAAPLVASMREAADRIRSSELDRFSKRLGQLDDGGLEVVESLTKAIIAKLLHEPSVRLKAQAGTPQGDRNAAAVRDLFDLS